MPTLTLPEFIARWQTATLSERAAAQSHFRDLCEVLGQPHPAAVDQSGAFYTFEKRVVKTGGGEGYADVWYRGHFAWEYKGKHKNLAAAYQQLLQYREDLASPPLLVVCDLNRFEVHTNFTDTVKRVYTFSLADLATSDPVANSRFTALDILRALFTDPARLRPQQTTAEVTEQVAAEFARLAASLQGRGHDPEAAAHCLMRLLFCLFAEDIGLLPKGLFTQLAERTRDRPDAFMGRLRSLFQAMAHGGEYGNDDIPRFNGGLFADDTVLPLTAVDLAVVARAAGLDWASVEPAIFGTLFERSLDPAKRAQLGAHYTSRDDILLIVEPVLMAPLRRRWAEVQADARDLLDKFNATRDPRARARHQAALQRRLLDFADELAAVRVLDPACGSGNFLYVALKRLLDLWKEVSLFGATHGVGGLLPFQVSPRQLYGLELNAYAHELASVVVWIGYLQWHHDNGFEQWPTPILEPLDNIRHLDAILAYDEQGRPVEPQWPEADVIIGNPPFLGGSKLRRELGDKYTEDLWKLYIGRVPGAADLVCYWFEKARGYIEAQQTKRAGLLATQAIRGGANRKVLERIAQYGAIFMAWSDRNWILDGAAVHVSIVGFDNGSEQDRVLDDKAVDTINPDLTAIVNVTAVMSLVENRGLAFKGPSPGGNFDIPNETAQSMLADRGNPNGKPNSDVIKRVVNAADITRRDRNYWTIDFGPSMTEEEASLYEKPFEHVRQQVYPTRLKANRYLDRWWLYERPRVEMREALRKLSRYIATPRVAKHRTFVWVPSNVMANDLNVVIAREDDYFLGVLQSKVHELWARRTGTQLREAESGFRYTSSTTFETFPFPWPPGQEPTNNPKVQAIAEAARRLVELRDHWLNPPDATPADLKARTLTNLYNRRPDWLTMAHARLDRAVLDAYAWPHSLTDDEILARLLALNLERAGRQTALPLAPADTEE
ncbi:MAG: class I SAM-dependent DNA methyltransferase [Anaerolineae bacterium]|nr:class I SAM-dependent DNA methyltransferase [Anaerolineae bacterium]